MVLFWDDRLRKLAQDSFSSSSVNIHPFDRGGPFSFSSAAAKHRSLFFVTNSSQPVVDGDKRAESSSVKCRIYRYTTSNNFGSEIRVEITVYIQ